MKQKAILLFGAAGGGLSVGFGAFGAHALKPLLIANNGVEIYTLASQYQFFHALALLFIGLLMDKLQDKSMLGRAAFCMLAGIILFSGSLYALALTGTKSVVFITPLGGLFFLAGWALLFVAVLKNK